MPIANPAGQIVALTGASGFIGRHAMQRLDAAGFRLRLLARDPARLPALAGGTEVVEGALDEPSALTRLVEGAQAVVHIAGSVRGATRAQFDRTNVTGAANCAGAAGAAGVPRFLLISSLAAREPHLSAYAASKRAGEARVAEVAGNMVVTVFRPPAVYGPGDTEMLALFRMMARGVAPVFGSPDARFSLVYVTDLADAIGVWAESESAVPGTLEIDDGKQDGYGWPEVCATVASLTGRPVRPIRLPGALLDVPAGINYALGRLGVTAPMLTPGKLRELRHPDWVCRDETVGILPRWRPAVPLQEGLRRTPGWR